MLTLEKLGADVQALQDRNAKVDRDKKWETSATRKFLLMIFTYIAIGSYLYVIGVADALLNAIVPTIGFYLSTSTLPFFRKLWEKYLIS